MIRQSIADCAWEDPWTVLDFASDNDDVELGQCAIRGLGEGEGEKMMRGAWNMNDFEVSPYPFSKSVMPYADIEKGIKSTWLIELLRLKDKYTSYPAMPARRPTPATPCKSPLSHKRTVFSPATSTSHVRLTSPSWKPSDSPLFPTGLLKSPSRSMRSGINTPPARNSLRREIVDWEAVAGEFAP